MSVSPSTPPQSEAPSQPARNWPDVPARPGEYYALEDPIHKDSGPLVVMLMESFTAVGTELQAYKQVARQQDTQLRELKADYAALKTSHEKNLEALNNLREVRRREKRAEIEKEIIMPGDPRAHLKR